MSMPLENMNQFLNKHQTSLNDPQNPVSLLTGFELKMFGLYSEQYLHHLSKVSTLIDPRFNPPTFSWSFFLQKSRDPLSDPCSSSFFFLFNYQPLF